MSALHIYIYIYIYKMYKYINIYKCQHVKIKTIQWQFERKIMKPISILFASQFFVKHGIVQVQKPFSLTGHSAVEDCLDS